MQMGDVIEKHSLFIVVNRRGSCERSADGGPQPQSPHHRLRHQQNPAISAQHSLAVAHVQERSIVS